MLSLKQSGFSLSEVLIALALLAVMAVFSIPKIMQSMENTSNKAIFLETSASLSELVYGLSLTDELLDYSDESANRKSMYDYLKGKLNTIRECPNGIFADGCRNVPYGMNLPIGADPGFVLANGATLSVHETGGQNDFILDANGDKAPNQIGTDQLYLVGCAVKPRTPSTWCQNCGIKYGAVGAPSCTTTWFPAFSSANYQLFKSLSSR